MEPGAAISGSVEFPADRTRSGPARMIGGLLAGLPAAVAAPIIASPQGRARRTAEIIREELGGAGAVRVDERLRELTLGSWDGLTYGDVAKRSPAILMVTGATTGTSARPMAKATTPSPDRRLAERAERRGANLVVTHGSSAACCAVFMPVCPGRLPSPFRSRRTGSITSPTARSRNLVQRDPADRTVAGRLRGSRRRAYARGAPARP